MIAANDLMAVGLMQAFQERGVGIPNDVSIIGFDDIDLASWVHPRLTTVRQDVLEGVEDVNQAHSVRAFPLFDRVERVREHSPS